MGIGLIFLVIAAICFFLAAIGRPAWPMLPIGLFFLTLAFMFGIGDGFDITMG